MHVLKLLHASDFLQGLVRHLIRKLPGRRSTAISPASPIIDLEREATSDGHMIDCLFHTRSSSCTCRTQHWIIENIYVFLPFQVQLPIGGARHLSPGWEVSMVTI